MSGPVGSLYIQRFGSGQGPFCGEQLCERLRRGEVRSTPRLRLDQGDGSPADERKHLCSPRDGLMAQLLSAFLGASGVDRFCWATSAWASSSS